ncbi:hypothetical protein PR048_026902 [Dryococelus australis]|uniref:Uncharacterized protein n=1 Tax=Dryococelus australis TaxID=614101 RepID=A0ABQ9GMN4_9NEOP|nr:hypothetical protein PR048_026902 [Dryococelus australis]
MHCEYLQVTSVVNLTFDSHGSRPDKTRSLNTLVVGSKSETCVCHCLDVGGKIFRQASCTVELWPTGEFWRNSCLDWGEHAARTYTRILIKLTQAGGTWPLVIDLQFRASHARERRLGAPGATPAAGRSAWRRRHIAGAAPPRARIHTHTLAHTSTEVRRATGRPTSRAPALSPAGCRGGRGAAVPCHWPSASSPSPPLSPLQACWTSRTLTHCPPRLHPIHAKLGQARYWSGETWAALTIEFLRADEGEERCVRNSAGMQGWGDTGAIRENSPTHGIVLHDSRMRASEGDSIGESNLVCLGVGEHTNHYITAVITNFWCLNNSRFHVREAIIQRVVCACYVCDLAGNLSLMIQSIGCSRGSTVAERLARSPPTKANRVQSPAASPGFHKWESCRMMPLIGRCHRGSPVSPASSFRHRSIFTSITLVGSQDLANPRHLLVDERETWSFITIGQCAIHDDSRIASVNISVLKDCVFPPSPSPSNGWGRWRGMERCMHRKCRNARTGETADLRENRPTSGIVRDDSHWRTSGSDQAEDWTRFALVGGEQSNRSANTPLFYKQSERWRQNQRTLQARCSIEYSHPQVTILLELIRRIRFILSNYHRMSGARKRSRALGKGIEMGDRGLRLEARPALSFVLARRDEDARRWSVPSSVIRLQTLAFISHDSDVLRADEGEARRVCISVGLQGERPRWESNPVSPWWEGSCLTATLPRPRLRYNQEMVRAPSCYRLWTWDTPARVTGGKPSDVTRTRTQGENGSVPECKWEWDGISLRKRADKQHSPPRSHMRKSKMRPHRESNPVCHRGRQCRTIGLASPWFLSDDRVFEAGLVVVVAGYACPGRS